MKKIKSIFKKDWKNLHSDFTPELKREWKEKGFSKNQVRDWINIGLTANDANYAYWLRDVKGKDTEWVLNNSGEGLRREYDDLNIRLTDEVIDQIKDWPCDEYKKPKLTSEQELLLNELIPNEKLRERYKNYGLCEECWQPNTESKVVWVKMIYHRSFKWCRACNAKHFQDEFKNWTSGNREIDKVIRSSQLGANDNRNVLEWIPYKQFTDIEQLAEGGFSKVYKAKWTNGYILNWNVESNKWERTTPRKVVLKVLNNSQNPTPNFLREVTYHKLFSSIGENVLPKGDQIINCYGISQDPKTKNYVMVMEYEQSGDLRQLRTVYKFDLTLDIVALSRLRSLSSGLEYIHEKGLIHKDFHPGNILNDGNRDFAQFHITDLGLCRPANETDDDQEGVVYGVLPYVAPEVLRGKKYTQASDVYSFGIVVCELLTGLPPYYDVPHDKSLALKICQGLRPKFQIKIPSLLEDLIKKCWDEDPSQRPTMREISKVMDDWFNENDHYSLKTNTDFYQQVQEAEKYNKGLPEKVKSPKYQTHPRAIYTSRLLDFKNFLEPQNKLAILEEAGFILNLPHRPLRSLINQTEVNQVEVPPKKNYRCKII